MAVAAGGTGVTAGVGGYLRERTIKSPRQAWRGLPSRRCGKERMAYGGAVRSAIAAEGA